MDATSLQDRVSILEMSTQGLSDEQIARQLHLKVRTVRKWRRRLQRQGQAGLSVKMGRPKDGAMSSFPAQAQETLRTWRTAHPGWGPKTLRAEWEAHEDLRTQPIASRPVIARWLKRQGLSRTYERHHDLPQVRTGAPQACHEEWEMDARGHEQIRDVGVVSLIDVNDVFSKVKLISYPCWLGAERASRHPDAEDYQLVLRLAFMEWGLPDRLAVDHDSVFYDNHSKSPFPTRFHLWLIALGIQLAFGRMGQPTDQATTERSHQTWQHQVLDGQCFTTLDELYQALCERRAFLNQDLPCATLDEQPPLVVHPEAKSPRRPYRPEWEVDQIDLERVYRYLSQGRWFRKASNVGAVSLGRYWYCLGSDWARQEVEITFDLNNHHFVFKAADGKGKTCPARGLTTEDLIGELGSLARLPVVQLALPFTWDEWRRSHLITH